STAIVAGAALGTSSTTPFVGSAAGVLAGGGVAFFYTPPAPRISRDSFSPPSLRKKKTAVCVFTFSSPPLRSP
ncbi:hypothetical protein CWI58_04135, partial [Neisseria meningitidis]